jgi:hypothetical protein
MLLAFIIGLFVANTAIAPCTSLGFLSAGRARSVYVTIGALTAAFSLIVGGYFVLGAADRLPDLPQVLGAVTAAA